MQIVKLKFIGTSTRFTTNTVYDSLGNNGNGTFMVLDDANVPFGASVGSDWQLEYVAVFELKQLYP